MQRRGGAVLSRAHAPLRAAGARAPLPLAARHPACRAAPGAAGPNGLPEPDSNMPPAAADPARSAGAAAASAEQGMDAVALAARAAPDDAEPPRMTAAQEFKQQLEDFKRAVRAGAGAEAGGARRGGVGGWWDSLAAGTQVTLMGAAFFVALVSGRGGEGGVW